MGRLVKSHTHCQAAQGKRSNQSLPKSASSSRTDKEKIKHESTTLAIRNAGESTDMKVIKLNKLTAKRKVKCLEVPHYA